jgi:hypothetical protein
MTDITVAQAVRAAKNFFDAHPDRLIAGRLAVDENGWQVPTDSPKATCFCALGRVCKELGVDTLSTDEAIEILRERTNTNGRIFTDAFVKNDNYNEKIINACNMPLGNIDGINLLLERIHD